MLPFTSNNIKARSAWFAEPTVWEGWDKGTKMKGLQQLRYSEENQPLESNMSSTHI